MGWLDKAKVALGILDEEDLRSEDAAPRAKKRINPRNREDRPPLDDFEAPPQETLEDVLVAREAGELTEMRRLLEQIDRGRGLRLVLRAAAALERGDEQELVTLLPKVREEKPPWKLPLQVAAALDDEARAASLRKRAAAEHAPGWALSWTRALSDDPDERRHGLVELLFDNAPLARTVAARDLKLEGVEDDAAATQRYVSFAHGRDCVRRFGASLVADLLERSRR